MSNEDNKIPQHNHGEKPMIVPFMIYADLECLFEKMHSCQNNPEKFYTEEKLCIKLLFVRFLQIVCLMQLKCKLDCYRGKDFVKTQKSMKQE